MRRANLSKNLHGLFIFICAICLLSASPLAAGGVTFGNLKGIWNYNSIVSGPASPWWERGFLTVATDGTFTFSGAESNGNVDSGSGAFSISSDGIAIDGFGSITPLCQIDSGNTVLVCTATDTSGSSELIIFTKQATSSYSMANAEGNWEGSILISGPTSGAATVSDLKIKLNGKFMGTYTPEGGSGTPSPFTGQISITEQQDKQWEITCSPGGCLSSPNSYGAFMDSGKTVMVGTSWDTSGLDAQLFVYTKQATTSYLMANLVGTWQGNQLGTGSIAPYWRRDYVSVYANRTFTGSYTDSNGLTGITTAGTLSISSTGGITCVTGDCEAWSGVMDSGKTVWVSTEAGGDGAGRIQIFTKVFDYAGTGSLTVAIEPPAVAKSGAQWCVDGQAWQSSGANVSGLTLGFHTVGFSGVDDPGWEHPANQIVDILGPSTSAQGLYVFQGVHEIQANATYIPEDRCCSSSRGAYPVAGWNVDGGPCLCGGQIAEVELGAHKVCFWHSAGDAMFSGCQQCWECTISGKSPLVCDWMAPPASSGLAHSMCGFTVVEIE